MKKNARLINPLYKLKGIFFDIFQEMFKGHKIIKNFPVDLGELGVKKYELYIPSANLIVDLFYSEEFSHLSPKEAMIFVENRNAQNKQVISLGYQLSGWTQNSFEDFLNQKLSKVDLSL